MSFIIKDDDVLDKYIEIWDKIKETLSIKFHSTLIYGENYIKAKVREFNCVVKTNFEEIKNQKKESMDYFCIACIFIDSVMRTKKKNHAQVYLENANTE